MNNISHCPGLPPSLGALAAWERLALLEAWGLVGRACVFAPSTRLGVHSPSGCVCVEVGSGTLGVDRLWLRINLHSAPSAPPGAAVKRRLIHQPRWNSVPRVPGRLPSVLPMESIMQMATLSVKSDGDAWWRPRKSAPVRLCDPGLVRACTCRSRGS